MRGDGYQRFDESLEFLISALARALDVKRERVELAVYQMQGERLKEEMFEQHKAAGGIGCLTCFQHHHPRARCPICGRKLSEPSMPIKE